MRTKLEDVIARFRVISNLEAQESEAIAALYGVRRGVPMEVNDETAQMVFEPAPCGAALRGFLEDLPPPYLASILVLMYSGRDREEDPVAYSKHLEMTWREKERAVEAICEKTPRVEYIEAGIAYLGKGKLNSFPKTFPLNGS